VPLELLAKSNIGIIAKDSGVIWGFLCQNAAPTIGELWKAEGLHAMYHNDAIIHIHSAVGELK
jgi:hypothetical protein